MGIYRLTAIIYGAISLLIVPILSGSIYQELIGQTPIPVKKPETQIRCVLGLKSQ